jgi:hypothetical protein
MPKSYKKVSIHLPLSFDTSWYDTAMPEDAAQALKLGATLHATLLSIKAGEAAAELEAKMAVEVAAIRATADERIASIQNELTVAAAERAAAQQRAAAALEAQRTELAAATAVEKERAAAATATRIQGLQTELFVAQEKYKGLEERLQVLKDGRDADIHAAENRTKTLLQLTLDEKERAVLRADAAFATLKEAYDRQSEELHALSDLIRKKPSANSRVKGTDYENEFREKLIGAYGIGEGFKLTDSARSGIGHAGDYLMNWGEHTILWEVKNYDRPVPTAEVEKFRRDMKENPQVRVGVMISRTSAITGQTSSGDRNIENIEGKLLIYLSNFESMGDEILSNLLMLFRVWWASNSLSEDDDEEKITTIRNLEKLYEEAKRAKTEWRLHKSHMESALRWMAERVEDSESRIRSTLSILQGKAKVYEVPAGIFRNVDGDIKKQQDIQVLLRISYVDAGSNVLLNDLAKRFSDDRKISIDTAKEHIRAVLDPVVVEAGKGKPIRINGLRLADTLSVV